MQASTRFLHYSLILMKDSTRGEGHMKRKRETLKSEEWERDRFNRESLLFLSLAVHGRRCCLSAKGQTGTGQLSCALLLLSFGRRTFGVCLNIYMQDSGLMCLEGSSQNKGCFSWSCLFLNDPLCGTLPSRGCSCRLCSQLCRFPPFFIDTYPPVGLNLIRCDSGELKQLLPLDEPRGPEWLVAITWPRSLQRWSLTWCCSVSSPSC